MVVRISGKGRFGVWSGREWEWWMVRVVMMEQMSLGQWKEKSVEESSSRVGFNVPPNTL